MHVLKIRPVVLPEPERLGEMGIRIAGTLLAAFLIQRVLFLVVSRVERFLARAGHDSHEAVQRARTLGQIFRSLVTVFVGGGALVHILAVIGWDVRPLLAGAGILGLAIGFGAQTVVRDVIAGVFILAENQFSVGDLIEINGRPATVEAISVRATTLRDFNGYVHFVPNGEMKIVTNRSRGWNRIAVDIHVAANQDVERTLDVCRRVAEQLNGERDWRQRLLDPVELWGVESVGGTDYQVRLVVRARPGGDAHVVARELRRRLQRALGEAGIRAASGVAPAPGAAPPPPAGTVTS